MTNKNSEEIIEGEQEFYRTGYRSEEHEDYDDNQFLESDLDEYQATVTDMAEYQSSPSDSYNSGDDSEDCLTSKDDDFKKFCSIRRESTVR